MRKILTKPFTPFVAGMHAYLSVFYVNNEYKYECKTQEYYTHIYTYKILYNIFTHKPRYTAHQEKLWVVG